MVRPEQLTLFHFENCPYCGRVERALHALNLHIKKRDILLEPDAMRELVQARGLRTVPVLQVQNADGSVTWMPESADIVRYLEQHFG